LHECRGYSKTEEESHIVKGGNVGKTNPGGKKKIKKDSEEKTVRVFLQVCSVVSTKN